MGIILDIILIAIILINVIICYKKGLVKLAVGLVAVFISLVLALMLYKPVSNIIIKNTEIDEKIKESIISTLTTENNESEINDSSDKGMMKYMQSYVDDAINKTKNEIVIESAEVVSNKIINICAFLGVFVVARILAFLLTIIADLIMSLPILKQFNKAGGIVYGIIKALLIIYVILAIIFVLTYITGNTTISEIISKSCITKIFYNNNILLGLIFR